LYIDVTLWLHLFTIFVMGLFLISPAKGVTITSGDVGMARSWVALNSEL
jgi:hypothetical protein